MQVIVGAGGLGALQNGDACGIPIDAQFGNAGGLSQLALSSCDPASWVGYDGATCGACAAVVETNSGTCTTLCEQQGLSCTDAWDDQGDQCTENTPHHGCSYVWAGTSDAICQCNEPA